MGETNRVILKIENLCDLKNNKFGFGQIAIPVAKFQRFAKAHTQWQSLSHMNNDLRNTVAGYVCKLFCAFNSIKRFNHFVHSRFK